MLAAQLKSKQRRNFSKTKKKNKGNHVLNHLFDTGLCHSLEASLVSLVDLRNLVIVLGELIDQLGGVELAVGTAGLDNLGLLIESEVLPGEVWADVLLEEGKDLVV